MKTNGEEDSRHIFRGEMALVIAVMINRIGTILAAFTMGKTIGLIGDKMDRHFRFVNFTQHHSETA